MGRKDSNKKNSFQSGDLILNILFIVSICLVIWGLLIYRNTIIESKYLLVAITVGIVIGFSVISFLVKSSLSRFWIFIYAAVIGGGIFYFAILFINQQFTNRELIKEEFIILEKGTLGRGKLGRCSPPYISIDFDGIKKRLIFYCDYAEKIKHSTIVSLVYSKGVLGFNVIKSKHLSDQ